MIAPTMFRRSVAEAEPLYRPIVRPETSRDMVALFRMNALFGLGMNMDAEAKATAPADVLGTRYRRT